MVGENLLNISKLKDSRFKIETDKYTYIYETADLYSQFTIIKSIPITINVGKIKKIKDNGREFIIITDMGDNVVELKTYSHDSGIFILIDKF